MNLAGHDEPMPYSDPWKTASRYAMLATVKGLPMTFYGQEQGIIPCDWGSDWAGEGTIIQPSNASFGFSKFELNAGKWVADYKTWNKMTVWDNPPMGDEASYGMAQLYGHVNWARASSPALQSDVQWMLDRVEGYRSADVWAMAKAEEYGALANGKDAVLAFVLFVNDTHYALQQTFAIPAGAAAMLGLEAGESYTARNLASSDAEQILWTKTTEELTGEGVWVDFPADQNGSAFYDDGAMVQFLKLEKCVPPATHDITVTVGANGSVSPSGIVTVEDGEDLEFTITADAGYRIGSVLADGVPVAEFGNDDTSYTYTWENVTADGTLSVTFTEEVLTLLNDDSSQDDDHKNSKLISDAADAEDNTFKVMLQDRTLYKDGYWNTLCLPFSVTAAQIAESTNPLYGATIMELVTDGDHATNLTNGMLTLTFQSVTSIEAGKPYIVKWDPGEEDIENPVFSGVTISSKTPTAVGFSKDGTADACQFVGQYSSFTIDSNNLDEILMLSAGNKLGYSQQARSLKSFCAHFFIPRDAAGARAMTRYAIDFGDESTRIESLTPDLSPKGEGREYIYNLQGIRIAPEQMKPGTINIINRKKTLKK